jgi:hypothetical protein
MKCFIKRYFSKSPSNIFTDQSKKPILILNIPFLHQNFKSKKNFDFAKWSFAVSGALIEKYLDFPVQWPIWIGRGICLLCLKNREKLTKFF